MASVVTNITFPAKKIIITGFVFTILLFSLFVLSASAQSNYNGIDCSICEAAGCADAPTDKCDSEYACCGSVDNPNCIYFPNGDSTDFKCPDENTSYWFKSTIDIPLSKYGFNKDKSYGVKLDGNTIGKFITDVYRFLASLVGLAIVAAFVVGGFLWVSAGGNENQISKARGVIKTTAIGAVLVFSSYTALYIINPKLVQFPKFNITKIDYIELNQWWLQNDGQDDSSAGGVYSPYPPTTAKIDCSYIKSRLNATPPFSYPDFDKIKNYGQNGIPSGYCAKWVRFSLAEAYQQQVTSGNAWDIAIHANQKNYFKPFTKKDDLKNLENGDLVFMYTNGTSFPVSGVDNSGGATVVSSDNVSSRVGMAPVSHIGVYVDGKIYHLLKDVQDTDVSSINYEKDVYMGISGNDNKFKGLFFDLESGVKEFVAGYADLSECQ